MSREILSLDGEWRFAVDPNDAGETGEWFVKIPEAAETVRVPHIWQTDPGRLDYHGVAWYERTFAVPGTFPAAGIHLVFEAVDYHARVWLNGRELGEHEGGFTPFSFDVSDAVVPGENRLTVRVRDPLDNAEIPIGKQGSWYTRVSGIWQGVRLEARTPLYVEEALVVPDILRESISVRLRLNRRPAAAEPLSVQVRRHREEAPLHVLELSVTEEAVAFDFAVPGIERWTPETPALHDLVLEIGGDRYATYFGMRSVSFDNGRILLNGEPVYIRGALEQAFYPGDIYRAPSEEYVKDEILKARRMGFNLLRKHIKAELPMVLYWADRLGMLVWAEEPNYIKWTPQATRRFVDELKAMIRRDYNRPAIIAWSLYNEEWGLEWNMEADAEKQRHVEGLYHEIKALDPTRLVCDNSGWTHVRTDLNDYHAYFALPDQAENFAQYHDEHMLGRPDANFVGGRNAAGQPILVSEFGMWGLPSLEKLRRRYDGDEPWWFENRADGSHQDDYKKPRTALANFHRYGIDRVFSDFDELARHSQRRMYRGVKAIVEAMRLRRGIAGYVVTEFTDIEWEANGWLDFFRDFKQGFENAAVFNGPLVVAADLPKRNFRSGESLSGGLAIFNDDAVELGGELSWSVDAFGMAGRVDIPGGCERHVLLERALNGKFPETDGPVAATLSLRLKTPGGMTAENEYELFLYPEFRAAGPVAVHGLSDAFVGELARAGWTPVPLAEAAPEVPVVTALLDGTAMRAVRGGAKTVFLAEDGDAIADKGEWTFRPLPPGEDWPYATSMPYVDAAAFPGLPLQKELGWEAEGLYPGWAVPFADYMKGEGRRAVSLFGDPGRDAYCRTVAGVFQGWLGQNGGTVMSRIVGKGVLTVCTWRIMRQFSRQPMAARILSAMLGWNRDFVSAT